MPTNPIDPIEGLHPPDGIARAAVLVIHGIGSQRPYETLDAFVQGVAGQFGVHERQLEHRLVSTKVGTLSLIRMPLPNPVGRAGARVLDFYEFHWAGMVEGRIKLPQVLGWLARTALTPLQLWAQQAVVILHAHEAARSEGSKVGLAKIYLAELTRALLLLVFAALIVAPFVFVAANPEALSAAWTGLHDAVGSVRDMGILSFLFVSLLFVGAAARGGIDLLRKIKSGPWTETTAGRWWGIASVATAAAILAVAYTIDRVFTLDTIGVFWRGLMALSQPAILWPLATLVGAAFLGKLLVDYLGDIALYTTADENSAYYRTRAAILNKSTAIVNFLCADSPYAGVYLAGHSLGSVIAYDTINRYIRDTRAGLAPNEPGHGLSRLRGLLTFGSPLDAVYYFFRTEVDARQPVRAQILSSLHGFRKRSSVRDYGPVAFAPYEIPRLPNCRWMNVYSPTDLISRKLVFYEVDEQIRRLYSWNPGPAHLAYWRDKEFYRQVARWF